jgi:2-polyprenyl-6-methoxyphenol hydroxylase-like FAD-dependent oxidoreductase
MARVTILGAGICGLAAGMLLARDGHEVTLLERDPDPVPASAAGAWEAWSRGGVAQFRQPHFLQAAGRELLEQELPDVVDALAAAGALRFDVLSIMPPTIADRSARPGDERLRTVTARRPVLEHVLARAAEAQPGLEVRRGVGVAGLVAGAYDGIAHVTGVRTEAGEEVGGDLVVDAMGRGSPLPRWVRDVAGAPMHEEAEDSGFVYYTRFFRAGADGMPRFRSAPLTPIGTLTVLVLPSDDDTWSVTLFGAAADRPLKRVRYRERWEAVLAACPAHAQWLGEPISDVLPMGGLADRCRRLTVDGRPLVTGVALLGDACACTNPSVGRGMTLGLLHARDLRDAVRALDAPAAFAAAWDEVTEAHLIPWYRDTVNGDRARLREIDALRAGEPPPRPTGQLAEVLAALPTATVHDPDIFRAFVQTRACYATLAEVLARPGVAERIVEVGGANEAQAPPGPDREQLLALLG